MKVGFVSLGCSKNLVDSEQIMGMFGQDVVITDQYDQAEVIFVNTCGFIESAKREAIDTILEMAEYKSTGSCQRLVVLGCLAQRYAKELKEDIPEIDFVVPLSDYAKLNTILDDVLHQQTVGTYGKQQRLVTSKPWVAYLKIAEGCDNRCSYCAIPLIRKGFVSFPKEELLLEASKLVSSGVKELVLIAQDTTRYGWDKYSDYGLAELLSDLSKFDGLHWIRVLYMYPDALDQRLIDVMHRLPKVLMYFDLPMQHGDDEMLKLMNRRGTVEDFLAKVDYIRGLQVPHVLRTTMIVGFDYESDEHFNNMLKFIDTVKFDKLGAFTYSREEDTPAYTFEGPIDETVKRQRLQQVLLKQQEISLRRNRELIGQQLEMVVEQVSDDGYLGRSLYHSPDGVDGIVKLVTKQSLTLGSFVKVTVTDGNNYDLVAVL